ncbi:hypothetical protein V865_007056 [Kwoniella europaea PYCC6329]|uniref:Uncharacterized protein n=1 Tax=Kwoniella europaea PYCC6329 TaxID=1423913 RepID=A0AAX4KR72_9TREE
MNTGSEGANQYTPSPHGYGRYHGGAEDSSAIDQSDQTNYIQAGGYSIPQSANSLSYYGSSSLGPLQANVYLLPHQIKYQQAAVEDPCTTNNAQTLPKLSYLKLSNTRRNKSLLAKSM